MRIEGRQRMSEFMNNMSDIYAQHFDRSEYCISKNMNTPKV